MGKFYYWRMFQSDYYNECFGGYDRYDIRELP